jgi:hypothetical protein
MENELNHDMICIDGNDDVGKDFTSRNLICEITTSDHDVNPLHTSYPSYWTPIGYLIRMMNRDLAEEFAINNQISFYHETILRGSVYSFDRAMTQLIVDDLRSENLKNIQVSDRAFLANANTIAYTMKDFVKGRSEETIKKVFFKLLPKLIKGDHHLITNTNNVNTLLIPKTVSSLLQGSRELLDNLESKDAREIASIGYSLTPEIFPEIPCFVIQDRDEQGNWIDINVLVEKIIEESQMNISRRHRNDTIEIKNEQYKRIRSPNPINFLKAFYPEQIYSKISDHILKELILNMHRIREFSSINATTAIDKINKKERLDRLETNTANLLAGTMTLYPIDKTYLKDKFSGKWQIKQIKELLTTYSERNPKGNLFSFIQFLSEKQDYGNGYLQLVEALGELD